MPGDWCAVYPSFLKRLSEPALQYVWNEAARAVWSAGEVEVIGYSLPESDMAIRVLLGPLRTRLANGEVRIRVTEPCREVRDRWAAFLGPALQFRELWDGSEG